MGPRTRKDCDIDVALTSLRSVHFARRPDFAYYSGWRRGEVTGLTWREIDMAGSVIRLDRNRSNEDGKGA